MRSDPVPGPTPAAGARVTGAEARAWLAAIPVSDPFALPPPTPAADGPRSDPLSSVLRQVVAPDVQAGAVLADSDRPWSARRALPSGLGWVAVRSGSCWVVSGEDHRSVLLEEGDAVLLRASEIVLTGTEEPPDPVTSVSGAAVPVTSVPGAAVPVTSVPGVPAPVDVGPGVWTLDDAILPDVAVQTGLVDVTDEAARLLPVPESIVLRHCLGDLSEALGRELRRTAPGNTAVLDALGSLVLVRILRAHIPALALSVDAPRGLFRALADPGLRPALARLHRLTDPVPSVDTLAEECAMPRTTFLRRFEDATGHPPITWARRWRAVLARHLLATTGAHLDVVAAAVGYGSARSLRRLLHEHAEPPAS